MLSDHLDFIGSCVLEYEVSPERTKALNLLTRLSKALDGLEESGNHDE